MSNLFMRPLLSSHNAQHAEQVQQNGYHSVAGSFPLNGSSKFRIPTRPYLDAETTPLPSLPATHSVGITTNPIIDTACLENERMELNTNQQSIITPQLPSWKSEVPISEQSTDVHTAIPAMPSFRPLPAYSEQKVMAFGKKTLFSLLVGLV